jgi:hypothetical protein
MKVVAYVKLSIASLGILLTLQSLARAEPVRIVGLGAASCNRFISDVAKDPAMISQYYSWAQGYLSAILLTRPAGVDTNLNLNPQSFGPEQQVEYLSNFCVKQKDKEFPDGVQELYKLLRTKS